MVVEYGIASCSFKHPRLAGKVCVPLPLHKGVFVYRAKAGQDSLCAASCHDESLGMCAQLLHKVLTAATALPSPCYELCIRDQRDQPSRHDDCLKCYLQNLSSRSHRLPPTHYIHSCAALMQTGFFTRFTVTFFMQLIQSLE